MAPSPESRMKSPKKSMWAEQQANELNQSADDVRVILERRRALCQGAFVR